MCNNKTPWLLNLRIVRIAGSDLASHMEALESIVRKLRDGRVADSSTAPLVLVIDDVHAPAAPVVFRQVLNNCHYHIHHIHHIVFAGAAHAHQRSGGRSSASHAGGAHRPGVPTSLPVHPQPRCQTHRHVF